MTITPFLKSAPCKKNERNNLQIWWLLPNPNWTVFVSLRLHCTAVPFRVTRSFLQMFFNSFLNNTSKKHYWIILPSTRFKAWNGQKMGKNSHFLKKSAKKYSKIEVIYVIKIPVCGKSISKTRIIPKSRFYCSFITVILRFTSLPK